MIDPYLAAVVADRNAPTDDTPKDVKATRTALFAKLRAESIGFVVMRPFIEHTTLSSVVTVSGRDTGATLFGPADMQLSANTSTKTIEGHYTCHTKAVVTKPQNVLVLRDIMLSGYVAGGNCTFFDPESYVESIQSRLGLDNGIDPSTPYGSLMAFPCSTSAVPSAFSFTGKGCPWEPMMVSNAQNAPFLGSSVVRFLDGVITNARSAVDAAALQGQAFMSEGDITNEVVFVGPHRKKSGISNSKMELVPGQGHLGPDAVPGDKRWRAGESISVESARGAVGSTSDRGSSLLSIHGA